MDSMAPFKKTMMLEKLSFAIEQVINIMAIIFFSLIFSIMLLQIFFRYVLDSPWFGLKNYAAIFLSGSVF